MFSALSQQIILNPIRYHVNKNLNSSNFDIKNRIQNIWNNQSYSKSKRNYGFNLSLLAFSIPFFSKPTTDEEEDPIKREMKKAFEAIQNGKLDVAEKRLHNVLHMVQDSYDTREITEREFLGKRAHIYSQMANLGLLSQDLVRAEKLFLDMMSDCLACGLSETDAVLVEISLKLALIYARRGDIVRSDLGFRFCLDAQEAKLKAWNGDQEDKENEEALLGMTCNYYAKFLHKEGHYKEALTLAVQALNIAISLYSEAHPNVVNLLNDVAILCGEIGDFKMAEESLRRAIHICEQEMDTLLSELPALYCNLGALIAEHGPAERITEALEFCDNSVNILDSVDAPETHPVRQRLALCRVKVAEVSSQAKRSALVAD